VAVPLVARADEDLRLAPRSGDRPTAEGTDPSPLSSPRFAGRRQTASGRRTFAPRRSFRQTIKFALLLALVAPAPAFAQHETPPEPEPPPPATVAPAPAPEKDDDGPPRLSLPTQSDRDAWLRGGFRLSLGLTYGRFIGLEGAPSGRLLGSTIRLGLRLDADWSVVASFLYNAADAPGGLAGLRFAGTIDPTWHATRHLSFALGLGFGGIVEGRSGRSDVDPLPDTIETSYTFPTASPPLPSCNGVGPAGLARAQWTMVLGPRTATDVGLEVLGQWTGCVEDTRRVEPDSGQAIVRRQYWPHAGVTGTWSFTWR